MRGGRSGDPEGHPRASQGVETGACDLWADAEAWGGTAKSGWSEVRFAKPIRSALVRFSGANSKGERPWEGTLALWGGGIVTGRHHA